MSWTLSGKRCDNINEDIKYLREKIVGLEDQLGVDPGFRGFGHTLWNMSDIIIRDKGNIYSRLERIESKLSQMEQYHKIQQETTPKQTVYRKKGKKTKGESK